MPHVPRRYPSGANIPLELQQPPQPVHRPTPIQQPDTQQLKRKSLGLDKINLHTWEPNQEQLLKSMFGDNGVNKDGNTNGLVLNDATRRQFFANGLGKINSQ